MGRLPRRRRDPDGPLFPTSAARGAMSVMASPATADRVQIREQPPVPATDGKRQARLTAATIGIWSAVLLAVVNLWFWIAFALFEPVLAAPWQAMADYESRFQRVLYVASAV